MRYLVQGGQTGERFDLLIQFTKRQEPMAKAMRAYLVTGLSMARAADSAGVNVSHLSEALKALEKQAALVEQIKVHDLRHLTAR
ncbi:MAG: adhesin biosynthesis transcription regulatory family protein [Pararheinheimera sp.]|nr:adhesin biosynthesis transcription regulatory family protein [Rheinheimera sp.]